MKDTKQTNETSSENNTDHFGMSRDDLSMLNQVLQRVNGISGVSAPAYETVESTYGNDV